MRIVTLFFLFASVFSAVNGQEAVYFFAADSLKVRGDLYLKNNKLPFIILCHQDGSNRSEYYEVAPRLLNLNYNCLAIDLRAGGRLGFVQNETASLALSENRPVKPLDAEADISAAIRYASGINSQPVILLGSSYSASLCLLIAAGNPRVKAIVALSPGEYFQPLKTVAGELHKINQRVFVSSTQADYPYLQKMLSGMSPENLTLFKPEKSKGVRGCSAFYRSNENNGEYWFALMMFFKKLG
jgi:pimeloyl-ACP methyl ester carboxylesterase